MFCCCLEGLKGVKDTRSLAGKGLKKRKKKVIEVFLVQPPDLPRPPPSCVSLPHSTLSFLAISPSPQSRTPAPPRPSHRTTTAAERRRQHHRRTSLVDAAAADFSFRYQRR
ncbi:unnamed protein product [Citrullus colocynthis]|uniref:Uncharacterized protein n=1 Tax=Citrullus colocynthis TaxID=252529 RepID=A0ABP0XNK7_9ROSI